MQALLDALDAMDGDTDLEPSVVGGVEWRDGQFVPVLDDRDGGDVLDEGEPNDWDAEDSDPGEDNGDDEHLLGWGFGEDFRHGYAALAYCTDLERNEAKVQHDQAHVRSSEMAAPLSSSGGANSAVVGTPRPASVS
jgi:hypothetical protein